VPNGAAIARRRRLFGISTTSMRSALAAMSR
jgi:hypothetical protein